MSIPGEASMTTGFVWIMAPWLFGNSGQADHKTKGWNGGVGVLGDSYSDEYAFYPPHRHRARNWVEILADLRGINFGSYSTESRGEPRNQGYEYNWARSAATTHDMIEQGQHTGLAEQVARGDVGLVCVFIGGNDYIEAMSTPDPESSLASAIAAAKANLDEAVSTILRAHPDVRVLLATVPDIRELPEFHTPLIEGKLPRAWLDAATRAIREYNDHIRNLSRREPRIALVDLALGVQVSRLLAPRLIQVGGRRILRMSSGDTLDSAFLPDGRHAGTLVQGIFARLFLAAWNRSFGAEIPALSDRELLNYAERAEASSTALEESEPFNAEALNSITFGTPLGR